MWSADETVVFSSQGYTNGQAITSYNGTNFSISFNKGSNSNAPKYYTTGSAIRCYGGNYFTVYSGSKTIIKIELVFGNGDGSNSISSDVITYSNGEWNGESSSIKFTISGSSGHRRIASVAVTYKADDTPCDSVSITLSPTSHGTASLSKTKVCPDDEIEVTYTPDEGYMLDKILANDVEVENPITITESTTIQVLFKEIPPEPSIDIARWDTNAVYINIDNFEGLTAEIEGKSGNNIADDLFFSKYFEAAGNVKLWAVYNGTDHDISLANVKVLVSSNGAAWDATDGQKYKSLSSYGNIKPGYIVPGEEIIVYNPGHETRDDEIIQCAEDSGVVRNNWYTNANNVSNFSGDDGLLLLNGSDTLDIIGIMEPDYFTVGSKRHSIGTTYNPIGDDYGWYCENGETVNGETTSLSTNRCLLIRKSSVKSGQNAISKNRKDFVTLCDEWVGNPVATGDEVTTSCKGFTYVSTFDYTQHYSSSVDLIEALQKDGTYKLEISQLDTLACNNIKIIAKDNSSAVEETFKVPIMVKANSLTTDEIFTKEGSDCAICDVVILNNKTLTASGTASKNRNVTVYPGGKLNIPEGTIYNINKLTLRKEEDSVPILSLKGKLNVVSNIVNITMRMDPTEWHFFNLPAAYNLSDIKYSNGKPATHKFDFYIKDYDGENRAKYQTQSWVWCSEKLAGGKGYIIALPGNGKKKKELLFQYDTTLLDREYGTKSICGLRAWGNNNPNLRPNHKGWNLIGNPFMDYDTIDIKDPIRSGYLQKEMKDGRWTGEWELVEDKQRYAVVPSKDPEDIDAGGYKSVLLDEYILKPYTSFFVQLGGDADVDQEITFKNSHINRAPHKFIEREDKEIFLRIKINDKKLGMFISDKFTEEYELGDDLESRYKYYQLIGGNRLLYSAIPMATLEKGIQIYSEGGILSLDSRTDIEEFEYIYIQYKNRWYNLLYRDVEVEKGTFMIQAKKKSEFTATQIEEIKEDTDYQIYSIDGKYIGNRVNEPGIYIFKSNTSVKKVIIK